MPEKLTPGSQFGRFSIVSELGAGGMGRVFRAHDPTLRRPIAIKILRDDLPATGADLLAEARSASGLNHPNICTIYEVGEVDGVPFIAMELVDGRPLTSMTATGALPADAVVRIGIQIAGALAHAHEHGVVHGDLKTHNVMVTGSGSIKLLDFGLARTLEPVSFESITRPLPVGEADRVVAGTLPYMAPETLRGAPLKPAADVWALGVLLHEMAAGGRPFVGENSFELASAILNNPPRALPSSVPVSIAAVIERCLQKDPALRYRTARDPFLALEPLTSRSTGEATQASSGALAPARRAPRPGRVASIAVVALLVMAGATGLGYAWRYWRGDRAIPVPAHISSLLVLPFDNLSSDAGEDYFADGMTEALITDLSRIPNLKVISRTSSIRVKAQGKSSQDIARELGVDAIVDGSVLRSANQVRITVRLVDAATDRNRWGEDYTRELKDVLALQSDVARAIASEIKTSFVPSDEARFARAAPVNPAAHEELLKGRHQWNKRTPAALKQALAHFQQALVLQPDYAPAHAGIAQCYVLLSVFPLSTMPPGEVLPQAKAAAERALALDDGLAEAHAAIAYERLHARDWTASEASFRRAIAVNPGYATAHFWYAAMLGAAGRFEESIDQARQAQTLDPVSPIIVSGVSWAHHLARRFDQEVETARAALALEPDFMMARYRLAEGLLHKGRMEAAVAEFEKALSLSAGSPDLLAQLAYARGRAGQRRQALDLLRTLTDLSKTRTRYVSPYAIALVHTGLGDRDQAFAWLERALTEGAWGVAFLQVEADVDPLRSDPRYAELIARAGVTR
jgi:TolB-like protein/Tfp pilus assembly protein PilF